MILIKRYNPTPRDVWYSLHHYARYMKGQHETDRKEKIIQHCKYFENKFNIDSDYLMESMGKYALSIT